MLRAAVNRQIEVALPMYRIHAIGEGPLHGRIKSLVRMRVDGYEILGSTSRAANLLAMESRIVRERFDFVRDLMRDQIERQFASELKRRRKTKRRAIVAAIDALLQFESLAFYRQAVRNRGDDSAVDYCGARSADRSGLSQSVSRTPKDLDPIPRGSSSRCRVPTADGAPEAETIGRDSSGGGVGPAHGLLDGARPPGVRGVGELRRATGAEHGVGLPQGRELVERSPHPFGQAGQGGRARPRSTPVSAGGRPGCGSVRPGARGGGPWRPRPRQPAAR